MSEFCKGCGISLQNENPDELGYVPSMDAQYCKRCFRIRNYGDVVIHMADGIENRETFEKIRQTPGTIFWIADLFDLEGSLIDGINEELPGRKIVLVLSKRDLLPETLSEKKILENVSKRLQERGIHVDDMILSGHLLKKNDQSRESIDDLKAGIARHLDNPEEPSVIFMGMANAGKSTIVNRLLNTEDLTTSRYPGTTLDMVRIEADDLTVYDTPGLENHHSILHFAPAKMLKSIIPQKPIKPYVAQIYEDQSFAIGGLARLDVVCSGPSSVVGYFSPNLSIHRGKKRDADRLWNTHLGGMLSPNIDLSPLTMHTWKAPEIGADEKIDIVIQGLGWFCVSGAIDEIYVRVHKGVHVTFRKAFI